MTSQLCLLTVRITAFFSLVVVIMLSTRIRESLLLNTIQSHLNTVINLIAFLNGIHVRMSS